MRFTTNEDVNKQISVVFAAISEFEAFERAALRRGASVERTGRHSGAGAGQAWTVRFRYRGRERALVTRIVRFAPPNGITSEGHVGSLEGVLAVDLTALSPHRTRLKVDLDIKPTSLSGRLLLQPLRLAKRRLTQRFKKRVASFARDIESR